MTINIIAAVCAFAGGLLISLINSVITSNAINGNKTSLTATVIFTRQILNIGYLVIVFLISSKMNINLSYSLLGAAFGLTVPSLIYAVITSKKLSKRDNNQENNQNG